jgi:putative DNA primase/helicase
MPQDHPGGGVVEGLPPPRGPPSSTTYPGRKARSLAGVVNLGEKYEVRLSDGSTFVLDKVGWENELGVLSRLPPPHGLTPEEVEAVREAIRGLSNVAVVSETPTATTTETESLVLPEELGELVGSIRGRRGSLLIPKVASILVDHLTGLYHIKTPVVGGVVLGIYCYRDGVYVECEEMLEHLLQEYYRIYGLEDRGIRYRSLRNEFIAQLEDRTKVFRGFDHHLLLFKNKVVDWRSLVYGGKLVVYDPSPDLMVYHRIPWEIDLDVLARGLGKTREELVRELESEVKEVTDVFKSWVGDKWVLLYEVIGYTLLAGEYPLNKAIMLVGEGRNGKSTYLELVKRLLGSDNVVSIKLQDLTNDKTRFMISYLYGKMCNIFADLPSEALRNTGLFKVLTGEDTVTADRKFRDPITFRNYAKMLYSCNELPKVYDMTTAFWRRWLVVEFPNQFPPNEDFKKKLYSEILPRYAPRILAYSLLLVRCVVSSGRFSFEESEVDYRELWLRETNSVYAFIKDMLKEGVLAEDPEARVKTDELYSLYVKYCSREERDPLGRREFTIELQRLGYMKVKVKGYHYYRGLKVVGKFSEGGLEEE